MTRLVPSPPQKVIKVLERVGFRVKRQRGSHVFLAHADGRATVVPSHKGEDISRGLLRKILRDADIDVPAFMKLLK